MTQRFGQPRLRPRDIVLAYTLLRIVLGLNFFNHGFVRLGNIPGFADSMVELFREADSFLPDALVWGPALFVPIIELISGFCITLGLATRPALIAGFSLMAMLMYGITLLQNWTTATSQLVYCLVFFILLAGHGFNRISIDRMIQQRQAKTRQAAPKIDS
ncbi:DoxX family protein [Candidatus Synechococcus calcipolaris G9]|uniref:DoxX family protein n=1 Tax=Candidatus Synechococcus calcipolaris G9 TaxID=1497997 RepID=A0ABT6F1J2_9SYNE|nr:DoxX family protein [Candidatus Synechococcus calcipolaris]MDG2991685.1 DoxX family protein [Candidatus Synechococcus calcipolaris G9]